MNYDKYICENKDHELYEMKCLRKFGEANNASIEKKHTHTQNALRHMKLHEKVLRECPF